MLKYFYEKYMLFIGIIGQLAIYIQAYLIFTNKSAVDVSLVANLFTFVSLTSWLIYGLILKNKILIISNLFAVIGNIWVLTGIWMYSQ
jgi:MtN3 and saliva related transmembrane protein